ncbi:hypothetical protein EJ02DRAFT_349397, partial [Clathrospora elynae]
TLETELFSVNDTACLQTALCKVDDCDMGGLTHACVAVMRDTWKVERTFVCLRGV